MLSELENYYNHKEEPVKSALLALREIIMTQNKSITATYKYGAPFFCFHHKMFCYLWVHKKLKQPYIGFIEGKHLFHPDLIQENRARIKILVLDANKNLPVKKITTLIKQALQIYTSGIVRIK